MGSKRLIDFLTNYMEYIMNHSLSVSPQNSAVAKAKKDVAEYKRQIAELMRKKDAAQKILDSAYEGTESSKEAKAIAKAKAAAVGVKFLGVQEDGTIGKPLADLKRAAHFARHGGKVYAIKDSRKQLIAFWDNKMNGRTVKGEVLHFTKAGLKYEFLLAA
jgi:hypothetical protein